MNPILAKNNLTTMKRTTPSRVTRSGSAIVAKNAKNDSGYEKEEVVAVKYVEEKSTMEKWADAVVKEYVATGMKLRWCDIGTPHLVEFADIATSVRKSRKNENEEKEEKNINGEVTPNLMQPLIGMSTKNDSSSSGSSDSSTSSSSKPCATGFDQLHTSSDNSTTNSKDLEGSSTKRQKKEHLFLAPDPPAKGEEEVKKMMVVNRLGIWRFVASDSVTLTPQERQRHEMSIAPPLVIAPLPPRSPRCKGKKNIFAYFV